MRLLCPGDFLDKNIGVGCHFLLQEIFPTQELNPRLLCLQVALISLNLGQYSSLCACVCVWFHDLNIFEWPGLVTFVRLSPYDKIWFNHFYIWTQWVCHIGRNMTLCHLIMLLSRFSRVRLCATPEMAAHQAPLSLGFSRQEHWSGWSFPSPVHESEKWKWSCSVVSDPQRPHGLQPTRLLCPWDFPGKNTGVGCHCFSASDYGRS